MLVENQVTGGGRRYAKCVWCGSVDRDRLVYLYLRDTARIFDLPAANVLHIAPERCLKKVLKQKFGRGYIAGDKFTRGYWYSGDTVAMDITAIPYPNNTFDLVVCNHVLEHITNDHDAIAELYRVLKPGGVAVLQVPVSAVNRHTIEDDTVITPDDRKRVFGQFDHVRIYGQDYMQRLEAGGFKPQKLDIAHLYPDAALNPAEAIYVGLK